MTFELAFLGTGTSNGVPMIGCTCAVCRSADPRDNRMRSSAVIRDLTAGRTYLVDTGPELRVQALRAGLSRVDAVLYTHAHADHTAGLDDMRRFNELQSTRIPIYANAEAAAMIAERFAYAFTTQFTFFGGKPDLDLHVVEAPFAPFGTAITPLPVFHGKLPIVGYRIGDLAYVTDAKDIPEETFGLLEGTDTLVLNALRDRPHPTHLSVAQALAVIERVGPRRTYLIHLSHELGHEELSRRLPAGVAVAYDTLTLRVD